MFLQFSRAAILSLALGFLNVAHAQSNVDEGTPPAAVDPGGGGPYESQLGYENLGKLKTADDITPENTALLGETIDLNTGSLGFEQTDVSLPGNFLIEVAIRRKFKGKSQYSYMDVNQFENWLLDIPHIHTNQVQAVGGYSGPWATGHECSFDMMSGVMVYQGLYFSQDVWWTGDSLHVPGKAHDKLLMNNGTGVIASGTYPKVTASNWRISCIDRYVGGVLAGEGFEVESPDGLTYTFSQFKRVQTIWAGIMPRFDTYMYVTKVEDRFSNFVNYNYSGDNLTSIVASDGRTITLQYANSARPQRITSVTANGRVWNYGYTSNVLTSVTRPDGRNWNLLGVININDAALPATDRLCNAPNTAPVATLWLTHPNGAKGTFTVTATRHGRTNIPERLYLIVDERLNSKCFWSYAVTHKKLEGPGLVTMDWAYSYSQNHGTWAGQSSGFAPVDLSYAHPFPATATARHSKTTTVFAPDGSKTVHFFSRDYNNAAEGKETATDQYATNGTTLLSRQENTYQQGVMLGLTDIDDDNTKPHEFRVNLTKSDQYLYKSGGTEKYTKEYSQFDGHGMPSKQYEHNNFSSDTRYTLTGFRDGVTAWILNQPTTIGVSAIDGGYTTESETTYDASDRPFEQRRFGRWVSQNTSWHPDGNLLKVTYNATNRWVEYSNYKRGIARTIKTPQSLTTTPQFAYLSVDDNGWTTQAIDFVGNTTNYGYDTLGRVTLIDPVDAAWANTTISYPTTTSSEGLAYVASGMPKIVTTRGNHRQRVYLDALLRPILSVDEDTALGLARYSRSAYNAYGQPVFSSFVTSSAAVAADTANGTEFSYDGLLRKIDVYENTNTGSVAISFPYGNKIQVSDNKGNVTTTTYQAYGDPSSDAPTLIAQPEGVSTTMAYNLFGNMTSASQGGLTQYNVYDAYQNLCKIVRPDAGNQAFVVDAVGQLSWRGWGGSVAGATSSCDTVVSAADKITHSYDNLGNLKLIDYGDSSPDITTVFDKNSRPLSLSAGAVATTSYTYNSAGLLASETLAVDSQSFGLVYTYNSLGHLASLRYPTLAVVDFAPTALGEVTKAGSYASNLGYHPNGAISSLTYGNGRIYTTTQNGRRLPEDLKVMAGSTAIVNLRHLYDANANLTSITDYVTSSATRALSYDGLDRLKTASGIWGAGSYSYDVLGNLKTQSEGGQATTYNYNTSLNRLTSLSGANPATFTYDARGNVTGNGSQGFTYNLAGRLISSTLPAIAYAYDGHGRRVKKTEGGQASYSVYSQAGTLLHKTAGGLATDYIYAGDLLVAEKSGATIDYMHTDLLGSPVAGNSGSSYTEHYTPWGDKWSHPIQLAGDVGYTGHQNDLATGLTYMQARYYDPLVGRFMATDPVGFTPANPMSFNRYANANNNPYKYTDPTGEIGIIEFVIGAAIETAVQVGTSMASGQDFGEALGNVDVGDVLVAGAVSAVIPGVGNLLKTAATSAKVVANSVKATKTLSQQSARTANRAAKIEQRVAAHAEKMKAAGREVADAAGVATVHQIVKQTVQVVTPPVTPATLGPNSSGASTSSTPTASAPPPPPPGVPNPASAGCCVR